jgi:hypothetical protein
MKAMKRKYLFIKYMVLPAALLYLLSGCVKDKTYSTPVPKDVLQNDVIKRKQGPNIVGDTIDFAYAMAILPSKGKLTSAEVEASIDGATGTYLENKSYYYNSQPGINSDIGIVVGSPSVTVKSKTTVTFTKDTMAATLRYYYIIPEEARGKTVSFTFSAKSSNGESVSYKMGPYTISKMDVKRNIVVRDSAQAYISIADMAVYDSATAATKAGSIDLIYLYRTVPTTSAFNHALVAPAADAQYRPGLPMPTGVNNNSQLVKVFNLQDYNLAYLQYGIYIDDVDFQQFDFSTASNFAINMKQESGVWIQTADKKYRAYVYIKAAAAKTVTICIKRLAM